MTADLAELPVGRIRLHSPTEIHFGFGVAEPARLRETLTELRVARPLIVSDAGLAATAWLAPLAAELGAPLWAGVSANPSEADALAVVTEFRRHGCDSLLAVGGGSVIDSAKFAGVLLALGPDNRLGLAELDCMAGGEARLPSARSPAQFSALPPLIAVPTTAGTGSEVSRAAVLTLSGTGRLGAAPSAGTSAAPSKVTVYGAALLPRAVHADPELVLSAAPSVRAGAAMDAVSHAVESLLSPRPHPPLEAVGRAALARLAAAIRTDDPQRRSAITDMMMGALMAGTCLERGVGLTHCLSHPLSALAGVHHGTANGVLLPTVLEFVAAVAASAASESPACRAALRRISAVFAEAGLPSDPADAVRELRARLGLPSRLSALGVSDSIFATAVAQARRDPCRLTSPVRFSPADAERIYQAVL